MGTFILEMETGNAAFRREDDSLDVEALKATLHSAIERMFEQDSPHTARLEVRIRDENGNTVGKMTLDDWM